MIVPPVIDVSVPGVPATQDSCTCKPSATLSTYAFVAASVAAVGVPSSVILAEFTSTDPEPVVTNEIG